MKEQIARIIAARQTPAVAVRKIYEQLDLVGRNLTGFAEYCGTIADQVAKKDPVKASEVRQLVAEISMQKDEVEKQKTKLSPLQKRLEKDKLVIGVTGLKRMGKSTFLETLTGLDGVIPTGSLTDCTGAVYSVVNENCPQPYAIIKFHTESSFLEQVIRPYYREMQDILGAEPLSIHDFISRKIPQNPPQGYHLKKGDNATAFLEKLELFRKCVAQESACLNGRDGIRVEGNEIRKHIAQISADGNEHYAKWCMVERAVLHCQYMNTDISQVEIYDTPGLGDFVSGMKERLIKTVAEKMDVALVVKGVDNTQVNVSPTDLDLHGAMRASIPDIPADKWCFYLINKKFDGAEPQADGTETQLRQKTNNGFQKAYKISCKNRVEVSASIKDLVQYLTGNLEAIDAAYIGARKAEIEALKQNLLVFFQRMKTVLPVVTLDGNLSSNLRNNWFPKIYSENPNSLMQQLQKACEELFDESAFIEEENRDGRTFYKKKSKSNSRFDEKIKSVLQDVEKNSPIPSEQEINTMAQQHGGATGAGWTGCFAQCQRIVRNELSGRFYGLNQIVLEEFDNVRKKLAQKFLDAGKLKEINSLGSGREWWRKMAEEFKQIPGAEAIARVFKLVEECELSFLGTFQNKVRWQCSILNESDIKNVRYSEFLDPNDNYQFKAGKVGNAKQVKDVLDLAVKRVLTEMKHELDIFSQQISEARYSIAEEFVDNALFSDHARDRWLDFYERYANNIWPSQIDALTETSQLKKGWDEKINSLINVTKQLGNKKV